MTTTSSRHDCQTLVTTSTQQQQDLPVGQHCHNAPHLVTNTTRLSPSPQLLCIMEERKGTRQGGT